jgi:hypothetical protein
MKRRDPTVDQKKTSGEKRKKQKRREGKRREGTEKEVKRKEGKGRTLSVDPNQQARLGSSLEEEIWR